MVRKARFYLILFSAIVSRSRRNIFLGSITVLIVLFLLKVLLPTAIPKAVAAYQELRKPSFVEGVVGLPTYPNPILDSTETQKDISSLIFRGLTKVDSKGNLQPDLAKSFKAVSPTEYVFKLKRDITWQDGTKFTSDDVIYTVKTAQDPSYNSPIAANYKDVTVEKVNDFEVRFKLKEAFAPFPYATTAGIIPKHISLKKYEPIGTGPFMVKKITKDEIILTNKDLNIVFRFYPSLEEAKLGLKLGEVHALGGLSTEEVGDFTQFGNVKLYQQVLPFSQAVAFFNTKSSFLNDRQVRQALSYAVNKDALKKMTAGARGVVAKNNLPLVNWVDNTKERYPFSLDDAAKQLKLAGFEQKGGIWQKKGQNLNVVITSIDDPELNSIASFLKDSWIKLGIKAETKIVTPDDLKKYILPSRNFQVLVNFQELSPDPDQYVLWHTTQIQNSNITGVSSSKLDKLLEDARETSDQKDRAAKYSLFTTLLSDEAPAIFLYYPAYTWIVSNKVVGINLSDFTSPADRFNSFASWKIERNIFH